MRILQDFMKLCFPNEKDFTTLEVILFYSFILLGLVAYVAFQFA